MNWQSSTAAGMVHITTKVVSTTEAQTLSHYSQRRRSSWAKQIIGIALTSLSLGLLAHGKAKAISFTFEKVVDTSASIPGATGTFEAFGYGSSSFDIGGPSLDKGDVAFRGLSDYDDNLGTFNQKGIYTSIGGKLSVIADTDTLFPYDGVGNFGGFSEPSLDNGTVAFFGSSDSGYDFGGPEGIYTGADGKLKVIAETDVSAPGSTESFEEFGIGPSIDNGTVAFSSSDNDFTGYGPRGIYTSIDNKLNVVADSNTPVPGGKGNFDSFGETVALSNENVAFSASYSLGEGVYANTGGELNVVADANIPIPGGTGNFQFFGEPSLENERVAFVGGSISGSQRGLYISSEGELSVIADANTPIPSSARNFGTFGNSSLDNENVAFESFYNDNDESGNYEGGGIYTNVGGELVKVIAISDRLDGKKINFVDLGTEGLSGNQIAFTAYFKDNSQGIYVATAVPEPASVLGTLAFSAFGAGWMLKRRQKQQRVSHTRGVE